jgi:outer membrane protein
MCFSLFLIFPAYLIAQESRTIDIDEAVDIAMKNNIQVITAQNNYYSTSAAVLPKTLGANLPTISANASVSRSDQGTPVYSGSGLAATRTGTSYNSYSYSLDANYVLFDGLKKFNDMSQARINETSARFDVENTKQEVTLQVYQQYFTVMKNKQLLKITEENLKRSEEQLKRLEERQKLGAQIMSDVYRQRVQVGTDKLALNKAKNNLNTSKAALNNLIGLDVNTPIELKDIPQDVIYDAAIFDFNQSYQKAFNNRKDYLAASKRVESSRKTLQNARSGYYPTLTAFARYGWNHVYMNTKNYSDNDRLNFGLNLSVPIFSGFATQSSVIQADQSVQTAKSNLDNIRRAIALDIKISLLNLQTAFENVKLSEENVKSAKEDLRLAAERYNLGAATILDQITANTNYATSEANYIQAVYDFLYSKEQYKLAIGEIGIK